MTGRRKLPPAGPEAKGLQNAPIHFGSGPMNLQAPPGHVMRQQGERAWCIRAQLARVLDPLMALPLGRLLEDSGAQPAGAGRKGPFHIPVPGSDSRALVRPYARGGLLARCLPRGFPDISRGLAELVASGQAESLALPVAGTIGISAQRIKSGRWDMEAWSWWVPEAPSLVEKLRLIGKDSAARRAVLDAAASTIRRCHDAGLLHRDLNANNLIIRSASSSSEAFVVDLDRAEFLGALTLDRRLSQLRRLYRSLAKTGIIPAVMPGDEFALLAKSYFDGELNEERMAAFMRSCRSAVFWHSLLWR
jgi:hypothetical protein